MSLLLIHQAQMISTQNHAEVEIQNGSILIENGLIKEVFTQEAFDPVKDHWLGLADQIIDASHHVVIPGMVNCHHHMVQSLTRAIPSVQNSELFSWLKGLYPIWAHLTPEMVKVSGQLAMAELLLSGCTTSSDHLYIYPNGVNLENSIEAAQSIGMRFTATRGSMSVGQSAGGLPPDRVVEKEADILKETQRLLEVWHDPSHGSMLNVSVAPCSPFTVSQALMKESAKLARSFGARMHTHLAENDHDIAYTSEKFNCTPTQYVEQLDWVGEDVWHAHCVKIDEPGMSLFAKTKTSIAHCPCSNMRLSSGILPLRKLLNQGVNVGLGVDGSASNDAAHILNEARQAMLLARVSKALEPFGCNEGPSEMTPRQALTLATKGGAKTLGRPDIGQIEKGFCADIAMFRTDTVGMAGGAIHDPIGALLLCSSQNADYTIVNGRVVVEKGELKTLELPKLIAQHNSLAHSLAASA
jgi:8-oxoguanine deaminase